MSEKSEKQAIIDIEAAKKAAQITREAAEAKGITLSAILDATRPLLDARRTVFQKVRGKITGELSKSASEIVTTDDEETIIGIDVVDHAIILRAADQLHQLRGDYPNPAIDVKIPGIENLAKRLARANERLEKKKKSE